MTQSTARKIILTLALVAFCGWIGTSAHIYVRYLATWLLGFTFASVAFVHLRVRAQWIDVLLLLGAAVFLTTLDYRLLHFRYYAMGLASLIGIASLTIVGIETIWLTGKERSQMAWVFSPMTLILIADLLSDPFHAGTEKAHPYVFDLLLNSFDASLHVQLSFLMGQAFATWHRLGDVSTILYLGLPLVIGVVYAGQLRRDRNKALAAVAAFIATGPIGVLFYNLFPALGPTYVFQDRFPWLPLTLEQAHQILQPLPLPGTRNSMPSLHMTWVLLAWWYSRGLSIWERSIAMAFVVFTVLATLGTGEHYFIDLVVAFPFAVMMEGIFTFSLPWKSRERITAIIFGLSLTLLWILVLRVGVGVFWISPVLPWACCVVTVAAAIFVEQWLAKASAPALIHEAPAPQTVPVVTT